MRVFTWMMPLPGLPTAAVMPLWDSSSRPRDAAALTACMYLSSVRRFASSSTAT